MIVSCWPGRKGQLVGMSEGGGEKRIRERSRGKEPALRAREGKKDAGCRHLRR